MQCFGDDLCGFSCALQRRTENQTDLPMCCADRRKLFRLFDAVFRQRTVRDAADVIFNVHRCFAVTGEVNVRLLCLRFRPDDILRQMSVCIAEQPHHFIGQAVLLRLQFDLIRLAPACGFQLGIVHLDCIAAVRLAEEAREDILRHAPRLRFIIADIFHAQTGFLHDLAPDAFLERFADLGKACDQRVMCIAAAVLCDEDSAPADHADDHRRIDARIDLVSACLADECTFSVVMLHFAAADAAEPVVCIPLMQMKRRECRIEIFSGALIAQLADCKGLITAEGFRGLRQKEGFRIDGEQIDRRVTLCCQLAVTRELRFAVRDRSEQLFAAEAHHDAVRLRRSLLPAVV